MRNKSDSRKWRLAAEKSFSDILVGRKKRRMEVRQRSKETGQRLILRLEDTSRCLKIEIKNVSGKESYITIGGGKRQFS